MSRDTYFAIPRAYCPRCGEPATYDGNYFCTDQVRCKWSLPERMTKKNAEWLLNAYVNYMLATGRDPEPRVVLDLQARMK
jgi:hypothetical protein